MSVEDRLRDELRLALAAFPSVRLGLLFGSQARGTAGPRSDVDVAVRAPARDGPAIAAALSAACGREVDVVLLDDPSIPLLDALIRDSEVIYEAQPGAAAGWRAAALATLEIDRPWYERMSKAWLVRVAREGLTWSTALGEGFTRLQDQQVISPAVAEALRDAVGLRNLVAHGYAGVDPTLLHAAATHGVDDLDAFARAIATWALK